MPRRAHLIAAAVVCGLLAVYYVVNVHQHARWLIQSSSTGWLPTERGEVIRIGAIRPHSTALGHLKPGDELIAIDGKGVYHGFDVRAALYGPPHDYRVTVRRDGRLLDLTLRTQPFGFGATSFFVVAFMLVNSLYLFAGVALLLLRPRDPRAYLLALAFTVFSAGVAPQYPVESVATWIALVFMVGQTLAMLFWPLMLHFFLLFPEESPALRRWPSLGWLLYVAPAAMMLVNVVASGFFLVDSRLSQSLYSIKNPYVWLMWGVVALYTVAALVVLALTYRSSSRASRRKLRVVLAGTLAGFLPLLVVMIVEFGFDWAALNIWIGRGLLLCMVLGQPLVPLAFAYAIIRHQVIPVRILLRRSLRYFLVARGFFLIEAIDVVLLLAFLFAGPPARWLDTLPWPVSASIAMLVTAAFLGVLTWIHGRVMPRIDRRFFREMYDAQAVQAEIGNAARELRSIDELLALACARIEETFHPESLAVFLARREAGDYACVFPVGEDAHLRADAPLVRQMELSSGPRQSELGGLTLPILAKRDLLGILVLGPRLGDLPYSRADRRLLEAIAWQLGYAIENSRLVQRKVEEERLRREVAMASEVQRRLFPEQPPVTRRLDLAGVCHPAHEVGGDYYDFLELPGGRIGLAVADVAGKGISAALLMSVVQASLRSQAGSVPAPELVASMNELLYRSAARNRFASFFYAEFDDLTGRLRYVNAGHNPPLLVRADGELPAAGGNGNGAGARARVLASGGVGVATATPAALRLSTGGLVIGALKTASYEECQLELCSGDVLLAYTDGVTEAWSVDGEEFGEERLEAALRDSLHLPAARIADSVVDAVREFTRGAPQHDDITLVVAKVR